MIVCNKCRSEPRKPTQRWGNRCFAEYMASYRVKRKDKSARSS